jgi:hypothetical protein
MKASELVYINKDAAARRSALTTLLCERGLLDSERFSQFNQEACEMHGGNMTRERGRSVGSNLQGQVL